MKKGCLSLMRDFWTVLSSLRYSRKTRTFGAQTVAAVDASLR